MTTVCMYVNPTTLDKVNDFPVDKADKQYKSLLMDSSFIVIGPADLLQ